MPCDLNFFPYLQNTQLQRVYPLLEYYQWQLFKYYLIPKMVFQVFFAFAYIERAISLNQSLLTSALQS